MKRCTTRRALRVFCAAFAALLLLLSVPLPAHAELAEMDEIIASAYCVYNLSQNMLLYSKEYDTKIAPGATVKIMTGILAFEHFQGHTDDMITIKEEALRGVSGNILKPGLKAGEQISADSLLRALIINNCNDAAHVLAYEVAGSITEFVNQMNKKARELGCENTFFVNPTGLDDQNMYTTVHDLVLISQYASKNVEYLELTSTDHCVLPETNMAPERSISSRNHLVSTIYYTKYYDVLAKGLNAGATEASGYCVVGLVRRYGVSYLVVVMNSTYDESIDYHYCYRDARRLLDWAYANYDYVNLVDTTTMIAEMPVTLSASGDHVTLLPARSVEIYLPADADIQNDVTLSYTLLGNQMQAPVKEGDIAGILTAKYKGELVATIPLIAKSSMSRSGFLGAMAWVKSALPYFLGIVGAALLILLGFLGFAFLLRARNKRLAAVRHRKYMGKVMEKEKNEHKTPQRRVARSVTDSDARPSRPTVQSRPTPPKSGDTEPKAK